MSNNLVSGTNLIIQTDCTIGGNINATGSATIGAIFTPSLNVSNEIITNKLVVLDTLNIASTLTVPTINTQNILIDGTTLLSSVQTSVNEYVSTSPALLTTLNQINLELTQNDNLSTYMTTQFTSTNTNITNLQNKLATDETLITTANTNITSLQNRLTTDETNITSHSSSLSTINTTLSNSPTLSNNNIYTGLNTYNNLPRSSGVPILSNELVNKLYCDTFLNSSINNTITGLYTYSQLPISLQTPIYSNQLITKGYGDSNYCYIGKDNVYSGNNTFVTTTVFNLLPIMASVLIPNLATQLVPKSYTDATFMTLSSANSITGNNTWSGLNTYTTLPISVQTPINSNQLINKNYADTTFLILSGINSISGTNTYTGINTYNSLPISTIVPTLPNQLINKLYADSTFLLLSTSNTISGNNTVSGLMNFTTLPISTITPINSNQLINKNYGDTSYYPIASGIANSNSITSLNTSMTNANANIALSMTLANAQTITGTKTFSPTTGPTIFNRDSCAFKWQSPLGGTLVESWANAGSGALNPTTTTGDAVLCFYNTGIDTGALNICCYSSSANGIRLTPYNATVSSNLVTNGALNCYGGLNFFTGSTKNAYIASSGYINACNGTTINTAGDITVSNASVFLTNSKDIRLIDTTATNYCRLNQSGITTQFQQSHSSGIIQFGLRDSTNVSNQILVLSSSAATVNGNLAITGTFSSPNIVTDETNITALQTLVEAYGMNSTNKNFSVVNTASMNNMNVGGTLDLSNPISVSTFVIPTGPTQIGYTFSGDNDVSSYGGSDVYYTLTTITIPSAGVWMINISMKIWSSGGTSVMFIFGASTLNLSMNFTPLEDTAIYQQTHPTSMNSGTTVQKSLTFCTTQSAATTFYNRFYLKWTSANIGTITMYYRITRIA